MGIGACAHDTQGIGVLDVVMMPRGEAIVVFNTVMDCQMALSRDRCVASSAS